MNSRQTLLRDVLILFAFAGWTVALPGFASDFVLSMALTCLMYVALSTSWALFCGTTRYLSLATAAFFGVGAYTSALLVETWPWWQVVALGRWSRRCWRCSWARWCCTCAAPISPS